MNIGKVKGSGKLIGRLNRPVGYLAFGFLLFILHVSLSANVTAQDDPPDLAPPPLKIISKDEQMRLATKPDLKDRTKLSLEMMGTRLTSAEKLTQGKDFDGMFRELGGFHGLMDDAIVYLNRRDIGRGKVLDNFKRFEISLRGMSPRIEVIRREIPLRYDSYIRKLIGYLRTAREKATDTQFDNSVVQLPQPGR